MKGTMSNIRNLSILTDKNVVVRVYVYVKSLDIMERDETYLKRNKFTLIGNEQKNRGTIKFIRRILNLLRIKKENPNRVSFAFLCLNPNHIAL